MFAHRRKAEKAVLDLIQQSRVERPEMTGPLEELYFDGYRNDEFMTKAFYLLMQHPGTVLLKETFVLDWYSVNFSERLQGMLQINEVNKPSELEKQSVGVDEKLKLLIDEERRLYPQTKKLDPEAMIKMSLDTRLPNTFWKHFIDSISSVKKLRQYAALSLTTQNEELFKHLLEQKKICIEDAFRFKRKIEKEFSPLKNNNFSKARALNVLDSAVSQCIHENTFLSEHQKKVFKEKADTFPRTVETIQRIDHEKELKEKVLPPSRSTPSLTERRF